MRLVNKRGYLIDRNGNVINQNCELIFKVMELDSDDEIPAAIGFDKRKQALLSLHNKDVDEIFDIITQKIMPVEKDKLKRIRSSMGPNTSSVKK